MYRLKNWVLGGLLLVSQGAWATQDVSGIGCTSGELSLVTGAVFSASCAGDLQIGTDTRIEAGESITLRAEGSLWMQGTLVAPRIELFAGGNANVFGGLFSGSPDFFPDVNAVSYAGSVWATSRSFHSLVPQPFVHPVFGAFTMTMAVSPPLVEYAPLLSAYIWFDTPAEIQIFMLEESVSPVPEPTQLALFAAGLALLAWKRRSARK